MASQPVPPFVRPITALKWIALVAAVLVVRGVSYWAHPRGPESEQRGLEALRQAPTDVVILGDSVTDFVARGDVDRESLAFKLRTGLPGCTSVNLARSAHHVEIFEPVVRFVSANPATKPRLVVVPLNLRSFSNSWIRHPAYRFEELRRLLVNDHAVYDHAHAPLAVFQWYRGVEGSQVEYDRAPALDGDRVVATLGQMNRVVAYGAPGPSAHEKRMRAAFVMRYAQRIATTDDRVAAVRRLAALLNARGIAGLFYLTPVDVETAERYAGPRIRAQIAANGRLLAGVLAREGFEVYDWSLRFGGSHFSWILYPNEHLNERGRRELANLLVPAARDTLRAHRPCGQR